MREGNARPARTIYALRVTDGDDAGDDDVVDLGEDFFASGVLDLHAFHPRDVKELLSDFLDACRARGLIEVRIVHGKGTGALRETVHALLRRDARVSSFRLAGEEAGGWGATVVRLAL
jgi:dsDNA-specific endonuclease/ATPase MutS2